MRSRSIPVAAMALGLSVMMAVASAGAGEPAATPEVAGAPEVASSPKPASATGPVHVTTPIAPVSPAIETPAFRITLPSWMPDVQVEPGLDVIAAYALRVTPAQVGPLSWFHAFEMSRALATVRVQAGPAVAAVALEGVYSSSEGALIGVAGDSFLMRVREARAGYRHSGWLAVDAGIVPTFTIPTLDSGLGLRVLGPTSIEQAGIAAPADLGVSAKVTFPRGYGFVAAGAFNGEGYTNRELNRGKNIEVAALVHPAPSGVLGPLTVFAAYTNGSSGTGASRADRLTAALLWQGARVRGGASFTYALGVRDDGAREAFVLEGSLRAEPIERFIVAARGALFARDVAAGDDRIFTLTGAVGVRLAPPLEVFLALTRSTPEGAAQSAVPGSNFWEGRSVARFLF